ncbi:MAG: methionyl-tRNA formyltransferase [Actinomycetota bacterium]|nr:methionyl-tRNA formyltransferase [Actinomycetota bacterium]
MSLTTVFLGTPEAAVPALERLLDSHHSVKAVVTAPDRPKGRGMELAASPVKQRALAAGIPVLQPPSLRTPEAQAELAAAGADVFVVCAYGLILPPAVLDQPPLGCVNVHFSLLPAFRGAAPVAAAVLAGLPVSGVTIMQMDPGLDTGPILDAIEEPIRPDDDTGSLEARLAVAGAALLVSVLDRLEAGTIEARPQDGSQATYAGKVTPEDARIDWGQPGPSIVDRVRAFSPRPGAWTTLDGRRLKVWRARVAGEPGGGAPGSFAGGAGGSFVVATGEGALTLEEVQPEGGRRMPGADFLRGRRGAAGKLS